MLNTCFRSIYSFEDWNRRGVGLHVSLMPGKNWNWQGVCYIIQRLIGLFATHRVTCAVLKSVAAFVNGENVLSLHRLYAILSPIKRYMTRQVCYGLRCCLKCVVLVILIMRMICYCGVICWKLNCHSNIWNCHGIWFITYSIPVYFYIKLKLLSVFKLY